MKSIDKKAFYDAVRSSFGKLSQSQVAGYEAILDAAPDRMPLKHLAYCLATAFHETGRTMQPVVENLFYTKAERIRAVWPSRFPTAAAAQPYVGDQRALANKVYGGRMGNVGPNDGYVYRGRGLVQITGKDNYARAGAKLGVDLVSFPKRTLEPAIAVKIMFRGMAEGWFTGKKLSDYDGGGNEFDAVSARRIINGQDKAKSIAGYYRTFLLALLAAASAAPSDLPKVKTPLAPAPVPIPTGPASAGLFVSLLRGFYRLFGKTA